MFYIDDFSGFKIVKSDLLDKYQISHFFSTIKDSGRKNSGGVNFGFGDNFAVEETMENYARVAEYFGVSLNNITRPAQTHTDNISRIFPQQAGMGVAAENKLENTDGVFTSEKNIPLCVFTADCTPILIGDKKNKAVAAVHAGWRGTQKKIAAKAVSMLSEFVGLEDIICAVGPCISKCCFEVSEDVASEFAEYSHCSEKQSNGKYKLDLKEINKEILLRAGIPEENIDVCDMCTFCEKELFYSYRRDAGKAGRMGNFIMKR